MPHKAYGKDYERKLSAKKYKRILTNPPKSRHAGRPRTTLPEPEVVFSNRSKAIIVASILALLAINVAQLGYERPLGFYFSPDETSTNAYFLVVIVVLLLVILAVILKTGPKKPQRARQAKRFINQPLQR